MYLSKVLHLKFEINIQARCLQQKNDDENEDLHEKNWGLVQESDERRKSAEPLPVRGGGDLQLQEGAAGDDAGLCPQHCLRGHDGLLGPHHGNQNRIIVIQSTQNITNSI